MHELYLAESILNIVQDYAVKQHFNKVNSISLSFGRLSCIESKSLQFAFEVQAKNTLAENALLDFKILPAIIHCFSCEKDLEVESYSAICPACGGEEVILTGGTEELLILEMDVD
ncbi:MAG: hydrogenase maturation nickel metallochaperone HypA [Smithellaceae bacterium]|jgi:hydrogenase nickel incorporation protein HypA/HybF